MEMSTLPAEASASGPKDLPVEESSSIQPDKKRWWALNKELLSYKIHFFLITGAFGVISSCMAVIARNKIKIAPTSLTAVLCMEQFVFFLVKPLLGVIADYFNRVKAIILILILIQGITYLGFLAVPPIPQESEFSGSNHINLTKTTQPIFERSTTETGFNITKNESRLCENMPKINANKSVLYDNCTTAPIPYTIQSDFKTSQFWMFAASFIAMDVAANTALTLSDAVCYESIQKMEANFGHQRLWGAVGWGVCALIGGYLNDYTNTYYASSIVFIILLTLLLLNIRKVEMSKPQLSTNIMKDIGKVIQSKKFLIFELGVLISGVGMGVVWFYLIWFVTALGGSQLLCGLVHTMQCFGELPFMFVSNYLEKKLGYSAIVSLAFFAYFLRFIMYSIIYNPWLVLFVEWLHGLAYGLFYTAMISNAKKRTKIGTEATTQAVVSATYDGLGSGMGSVIAGYGFYYIGYHDTFMYIGIFFAICTIVSFVTNVCKNRKRVSYDLSEASRDVSRSSVYIIKTEL